MLTANQRDILAGVLTQVYMGDGEGVTYEQWIDTYEIYRESIKKYDEERYETNDRTD